MTNKKIPLTESFNVLIASYLGLIVAIGALTYVFVQAAATPQLSQQITAGTLVTDIRDASRVTVGSPSFTLSSTTFSFNCLTGGSASTGTLGSGTQRIYVDNPGVATNGWSLTIAATSGATALWQNGGSTQNYDFNDGGTSGCSDGGDTDTKAGQLTINPAAGTLTTDCTSCSSTNISLGTSTPFVEGTTNSVTLINAAAGSDDAGRWYLTGVGLSQTIPAEQPVDTYTLGLTITVTAS